MPDQFYSWKMQFTFEKKKFNCWQKQIHTRQNLFQNLQMKFILDKNIFLLWKHLFHVWKNVRVFLTKYIHFIPDKNIVKKYRMQEFYVSTARFCALILKILWKIYVTEFSYKKYHGWRCTDICDCKWRSLFLSHVSRSRGQILPWICRRSASIVLQG